MMPSANDLLPSTTVLPNKTNDVSEDNMINAAFFICFGIIVNLCNLLIIFTVLNFRAVSNPDVLILALAIADYLASWILFPLGAYFYLSPSPEVPIICDIYESASTAIQLFSIAIITLLTMDRFLAIRKPIFYRAKLSVPNLQRTLVVLFISCVLISCLPIIIQAFGVLKLPDTAQPRCFSYHSIFMWILLIWSYVQIPVVIYFFVGFIFYIRQFVNHKSQKSFDSMNSATSKKRKWYRLLRCGWKCCRRAKKSDPPTRQEILEKTISMMKHLNLKRCTRMATTAAWIVAIFYVVWTLALVTMTYQLITKQELPLLNFIVVRLTLIDSILNPVVYATICTHYKRGFQWTIFYPFRLCGYKKHSRKTALGLTASERIRVTQRLAIDEYESPGLNRRLYSRRLLLKNSCASGRTDGTDDIGFDNLGFVNEDIGSNHAHVPSREQTIVTTDAIVEAVPHTSRKIQTEISPPNYRKRSQRKEGEVVVSALEMQISDSGVDVESLHLDGAASASNSPEGLRSMTKDRGGSINSTQSDPVIRLNSPNDIVYDRQSTANHVHSVRIETSRNTPWQSADTLIKIHIDVLELLNESDMLGPYCLQSKIKRCKLRSSERPPALKFSPKENRFVDRRTSFDDLDAYYLDFTKPLMEQGFIKEPSFPVPSRKNNAKTTLDDIWNIQNGQDDLVRYSQVVMRKHKDNESMSGTTRGTEHAKITRTRSLNTREESTVL